MCPEGPDGTGSWNWGPSEAPRGSLIPVDGLSGKTRLTPSHELLTVRGEEAKDREALKRTGTRRLLFEKGINNELDAVMVQCHTLDPEIICTCETKETHLRLNRTVYIFRQITICVVVKIISPSS